jgi:hypothetical protein
VFGGNPCAHLSQSNLWESLCRFIKGTKPHRSLELSPLSVYVCVCVCVLVGGVYYIQYVNGDSVESLCRFIKGTKPRRSLELSPLSVYVCVCVCVQITNSIYHGVTRHVSIQVCVCSSGLLASSSFKLSLLGLFPQKPARGAMRFALRTVCRRRVKF